LSNSYIDELRVLVDDVDKNGSNDWLFMIRTVNGTFHRDYITIAWNPGLEGCACAGGSTVAPSSQSLFYDWADPVLLPSLLDVSVHPGIILLKEANATSLVLDYAYFDVEVTLGVGRTGVSSAFGDDFTRTVCGIVNEHSGCDIPFRPLVRRSCIGV
jgi:hypothetical protein